MNALNEPRSEERGLDCENEIESDREQAMKMSANAAGHAIESDEQNEKDEKGQTEIVAGRSSCLSSESTSPSSTLGTSSFQGAVNQERLWPPKLLQRQLLDLGRPLSPRLTLLLIQQLTKRQKHFEEE